MKNDRHQTPKRTHKIPIRGNEIRIKKEMQENEEHCFVLWKPRHTHTQRERGGKRKIVKENRLFEAEKKRKVKRHMIKRTKCGINETKNEIIK